MLEMVIAMLILFIGLIATASAISYALSVGNRGRGVTNSKLLVVSILEQMETIRNTKQLTYAQIANTGNVDNTGATYAFAGFPTAAQPVSINPGPDGIFGTADDLLVLGAGGTYQTDPTLALPGYTRQITIVDLDSTIKKITVTLTYPGPAGDIQTLTASSYLNNDAGSNYLP
jgi:hypothetical protein